jgi:hypothetical protein
VGDLSVPLAPRLAFIFSCLVAGCGGSSEPTTEPSSEPPGEPSADAVAVAALLGAGGPTAPTFVPIYDASANPGGTFYPTALGFNPFVGDELWITLRQPLTDQTCYQDDTTGCPWLIGKVAILEGSGQAPDTAPQVQIKEDGNAWHFMRRPTSISFNDDDTFATCAEALTSNYEDVDVPYNGPVLWSADPTIFGVTPSAASPTHSTHIDMLHETPYCMGIAHDHANVYWVFNGEAGSLDRYDFHKPHVPGGDDHSDGELERYVTGKLSRVPEVPSHLAFDSDSWLLYAADSGHGRIVALDTSTGKPGPNVVTYDPIQTHYEMDDAKLSEVVRPGRLGVPSGLTLYAGVLFVTDVLTSNIVAYDTAGHTLATLATGLPPGSLAGITIGPDGRAYFADQIGRRVLRVDPAPSP